MYRDRLLLLITSCAGCTSSKKQHIHFLRKDKAREVQNIHFCGKAQIQKEFETMKILFFFDWGAYMQDSSFSFNGNLPLETEFPFSHGSHIDKVLNGWLSWLFAFVSWVSGIAVSSPVLVFRFRSTPWKWEEVAEWVHCTGSLSFNT